MTSKQNNTLDTCERIEAFLDTFENIVRTIPNFSNHKIDLSANIKNIQVLSKEQVFDKSGLVKQKNRLKLELTRITLDDSRKLQAFAQDTNNDLLLSETRLTNSQLNYATDRELRKYAKGVYERAQRYIDKLGNYGITTESQKILLDAINAFVEAMPNARIEKSTRKVFTADLANAFKDTDVLLKKMDKSVEVVRLKEPLFYKQYTEIRRTIDLGVTYISLKAQVNDAETGEGIKNVKVVFTPKPNGQKYGTNGAIVKKTAKKGGFIIKSMDDLIYDVEVSKNGYITKRSTVAITDGEMTRFETELMVG